MLLRAGCVVFAIIAGYFFWSAAIVETTVAVDGQPVANLHSLQIQLANLMISIGSATISAIFLSADAIAGAISNSASTHRRPSDEL
jgi:hypothetical protein